MAEPPFGDTARIGNHPNGALVNMPELRTGAISYLALIYCKDTRTAILAIPSRLLWHFPRLSQACKVDTTIAEDEDCLQP
jgi:hypothetical protein